MKAVFAAQIERSVHGMMSTMQARLPSEVKAVTGTVESSLITVTMRDNTVYHWEGGHYSTTKRYGCYAPLQPKPITVPDPALDPVSTS